MERITQAKSKPQTHMLRRERFWSLPRGGQLATLALAGGWEAFWDTQPAQVWRREVCRE